MEGIFKPKKTGGAARQGNLDVFKRDAPGDVLGKGAEDVKQQEPIVFRGIAEEYEIEERGHGFGHHGHGHGHGASHHHSAATAQ